MAAYELLQEVTGAGGDTCVHTADILQPDKDGGYQTFGANDPVFKGMRSVDNLGPEKYQGTLVVGSNLTETPITDGYKISSPGSTSINDNWIGFDIDSVAPDTEVMITFNAHIVSGGHTFTAYYTDSAYVALPNGNHVVTEGLNEIICPLRESGIFRQVLSTNINSPFEIDFTDISIKIYGETYSYFADDGAGNILDPHPWMVYQAATENHFLNSDVPVTQDITVVISNKYTVWVVGAGSVTLSGAGSGTVTESGGPVTITASTTTLTVTYAATLTHVQVEDGAVQNGMIVTAGTSVSTDEILYTFAAANHDDDGTSYELDVQLTGGDESILLIGGTAILSVVGTNVVLSDGTNTATVAVSADEPHIKITYSGSSMELDVDGVTDTATYDGSFGSGEITTKATIWELERQGY